MGPESTRFCSRPPEGTLLGNLTARAQHYVAEVVGGGPDRLLESPEEPRSHDAVDHHVIATQGVASCGCPDDTDDRGVLAVVLGQPGRDIARDDPMEALISHQVDAERA